MIENALLCPNGGLVLSRYDDAAKEWSSLGSWALVLSDITYKPKINSRTVQGERTGAEAWQDSGTADGCADNVEEDQGSSGGTVNRAARLLGRTGQA